MKLRSSVIAVASCLLFAGSVLAQKQQPPVPGTPRPFSLPEVQRYSLPNGTDVRLVQYGNIPKVSVRLSLQTGNIDETPNEVWLADLVGDLMKQGTSTRSAQDVALTAARMGGSLNIGVGVNQVTIGGDVLSEFGDDMIALIGDVSTNPAFPSTELPRLKNDMLRRLSIAKSQPQQLAVEKFRQVIYPGHGYGRIFPTEAAVNSYTIEQVRDFYTRNFGAARSTIYVVGRFDESAVRAAIASA
ncbi:MAG TPA: insulinase family protein, partial [Thermoanaerobaculia bacterium]|nr:insulinase family protein [Thermoanaerobaculia bacterium]